MSTTSSSPGLAPEASWESAPSLIDGARTLQLTAATCDLDYWFASVAQGTLAGLVNGHRPGTGIPAHMLEPGPLRTALISELGFRGMAEERATRAISTLVDAAPDVAGMEFFATQLLDEARHARVFRGHILELGVPAEELEATVTELSGADIETVLEPLERFAQPIRDRRDYIGGVIMLTVLVEGVLAPAAELSERKWRVFDPAAAEIERGAGIDEIRHLTVGSSVVREHLKEHPEETERLRSLIKEGQDLWLTVPVVEMLQRREELFQQGIAQHGHLLGDYEIFPGRKLVETTVAERIDQALNWSFEMQNERLAYMGLGEEGGAS